MRYPYYLEPNTQAYTDPTYPSEIKQVTSQQTKHLVPRWNPM